MLSIRPRIAELTFQLFGRSVHPELFEIQHHRDLQRGAYKARFAITSVGHVVEFRLGDQLLTEVAVAANNPLPQRFRLMAHPLKGALGDKLSFPEGLTYETRFSLEPVPPEIFWNFQKEIMIAGVQQGLIHQFESSGRFGLGAFSYMHHESRDRTLVVQAIHTFPDDYAIVKSWSKFEIGKK